MARGSTRIRGSIVLAVLAALAAGLLTSPVGAAFTPTKKKIKTIARKQANKVFDSKVPGLDGRYLRQTNTQVSFDTLPGGAGSQDTATVNCPAGHEALGGGVHFSSNYPDVNVTWNGPLIEGDNIVAANPGQNGPATGWKVEVENTVAGSWTYAIAVICAPAA